MIRDLDETIKTLLMQGAEPGSELAGANINFDMPDAEWRENLENAKEGHTLNCYLYDIHENRELRTNEPLLQRSGDRTRAFRLRAPVRVDCAYCITAWYYSDNSDKVPVLEEHRLLNQALMVLLKNPTIPAEVLQGSLANQIPPYPTVIASPDGIKEQPQFWGALDQKLRPSLNYVVTLAMMLEEVPPEAEMPRVPYKEVRVMAYNMEEFPG